MAQRQLWQVFAPAGGSWRGIAHVPNGNLRLRDDWAHLDARRRFAIDLAHAVGRGAVGARRSNASAATSWPASKRPADCPLFGVECEPDTPVGACMVSTEGTCRIWHEYGGHPIMSVAVDCNRRRTSR